MSVVEVETHSSAFSPSGKNGSKISNIRYILIVVSCNLMRSGDNICIYFDKDRSPSAALILEFS